MNARTRACGVIRLADRVVARVTAAVGTCAVSALLSPVHGQILQLQPNSSELGVESRAERWWYDGLRPTQFAMLGEWLSVSASGMLVTPGVFAWSGTVRPYIGQQDGSRTANGFDSRNLGLSFGANLLAALPVTLRVNAHRSSGHLRAVLGGENDFFTSGGGGILSWRNRPLPLTLEVASRATADSWTSVTTHAPIRRDEVLRNVRFQAQNSKTLFALDRLSYKDRLGSLSFRSIDATFEHALRWGTGSVLNTSLQAGQRAGSFSYNRTAAGWRVLLHHSERASTDAFVQRRGGTSAGVRARSVATGGTFRLRGRDGWNSALSGSWNATDFREGGTSNALAAWRVQGFRALPGRATVLGNLAATYERLNQWTSGDRFLEAFDERHVVDDGRPLTLGNLRIDSTSIEVRNLDQTLVYASGIDYRIIPIGASLQLRLLPGSRIKPGDVLLVNYRFRSAGEGVNGVMGLSADLAVGNAMLMLRASGSLRDASGSQGSEARQLLSGRDGTVGVTLRHRIPGGRLELDAQHRRRTGSANDFLTNEVRMTLVPRGSPRWQSNLGVRGSTSRVAGEELTLASADAAITWTPIASLRVLLTGERWLWLPSNAMNEEYVGGALEVDWQIGRIETQWRYAMQRRVVQVDNNQRRLSARIVRRF
jgi:hypothetical protein